MIFTGVVARVASEISLRAFARLQGVALSAVQKAIRSGRVTAIRRAASGRVIGIDPEIAAVQWATNTDPGEAAKNGKAWIRGAGDTAADIVGGVVIPEVAASIEGENTEASAVATPGYQDHRTKREKHLADLAELEYLEKVGTLISAADVEREMGEILLQLKNNVFRIADRKAQILAAETDPARIHRLLSEEFRLVFHELSARFEVEITGGAEERSMAVS